jgi:hypothetical protein
VKRKLREELRRRKRRLLKRIDKQRGSFEDCRIACGPVRYELSGKQQAVVCGGLGMISQVVRQLDLRNRINAAAPVLKLHAPYSEADHVLNIAFGVLAGGTCLDHLELRRNDEAYLDALGARRIPDPTTAGDFCRRFSQFQLLQLMQALNAARRKVWAQQPEEFFAQATIEADGAMAVTSGEKKDGIGINHKGEWGYHPLVISLAETQELLYLHNRSGNRPSHENAAFHLDLAIDQCRRAGFRKIVLRGDTDFSQTSELDRWNAGGVEFVFGFDASPGLVGRAGKLPEARWKRLVRAKDEAGEPRATRDNFRQQIVVANEYRDLRLVREDYAEFMYQPTLCKKAYRMVVVRKQIECRQGQQRLFEDDQVRYFFYITNAPRKLEPTRAVIRSANRRCNQENTISQLRACHALSAPLDSLESNAAYMLFASLAWSLKQWAALLVRSQGPPPHQTKQKEVRQKILRMEFATFLNGLLLVPAQIIRSARRTVWRLLTWRPAVDWLLMLHDHIIRPLRPAHATPLRL